MNEQRRISTLYILNENFISNFSTQGPSIFIGDDPDGFNLNNRCSNTGKTFGGVIECEGTGRYLHFYSGYVQNHLNNRIEMNDLYILDQKHVKAIGFLTEGDVRVSRVSSFACTEQTTVTAIDY